MILLLLCWCWSDPLAPDRNEWSAILDRLRQIERREQQFDYQILFEERRVRPRVEFHAYRKYWTRREDSLRFQYERAESPKAREARVYNPRYEFSLLQRMPESSWELTNFYLKKTEERSPQAIRPDILEHWAQMFPSTGIIHIRPLNLAELAQDPEFRVISLVQDGPIWKASLAVPSRNYRGGLSIQDVEVRFDTSLGGAIRSYRLSNPNTRYTEVVHEYAAAPISDYWPPTKTTIRLYDSTTDRTPYMTRTITYESITPTKYTDRDFTLSAFGLPEPPGEETPGWRINSYLLIAASLAAVATLLFWWLARRKKP